MFSSMEKNGIRVMNTPDTSTTVAVELTLDMILDPLRQISRSDRLVMGNCHLHSRFASITINHFFLGGDCFVPIWGRKAVAALQPFKDGPVLSSEEHS